MTELFSATVPSRMSTPTTRQDTDSRSTVEHLHGSHLAAWSLSHNLLANESAMNSDRALTGKICNIALEQ